MIATDILLFIFAIGYVLGIVSALLIVRVIVGRSEQIDRHQSYSGSSFWRTGYRARPLAAVRCCCGWRIV